LVVVKALSCEELLLPSSERKTGATVAARQLLVIVGHCKEGAGEGLKHTQRPNETKKEKVKKLLEICFCRVMKRKIIFFRRLGWRELLKTV